MEAPKLEPALSYREALRDALANQVQVYNTLLTQFKWLTAPVGGNVNVNNLDAVIKIVDTLAVSSQSIASLAETYSRAGSETLFYKYAVEPNQQPE